MCMVRLEGTHTIFTRLRASMHKYTSRKALFKSDKSFCFVVSSLGGVEAWARGCSRDEFRLTTVARQYLLVAYSYVASCLALKPPCLLYRGRLLHVKLDNNPENNYFLTK